MSSFARKLVRARASPHARYSMWVANAAWPSDAEVARVAARRLSFAVFNYDSGAWAAKIKALDPGIKLFAYVCLSSARSYEPTIPIAGAVAYNDAVANGWITRDSNNQEVTWAQYTGHYQMTVWNSAYQDAYLAHIRTVLENPLWDGVWADNDFWTLRYYSSAILAGTTTQDETDQKLRAGLDILVSRAGAFAKSYGKTFMPNYGDGKLSPTRQAQHASYGGGSTEEMFMAWPWSPPSDPNVPIDYASAPPQKYLGNSWSEEVGNVRSGIINGAITQIPAVDSRCTGLDMQVAIYGYTSYLLNAAPGNGWMPSLPVYVQSVCPWYDFQSADIGYPLGPYQTQGTIYTRTFERAFVAVNPTLTTQTVTLPDGTTQSIGGKSGLFLPR